MINPISSSYTSYQQTTPPVAQKAEPQPTASLPQDTVSLKSTGDVDHDGDSH
jgi:hypothetical protein